MQGGHNLQQLQLLHRHNRWHDHNEWTGWWEWPWQAFYYIPATYKTAHLKLNLDMLQFKTKQTTLFYATFASDGYKPDDEIFQTINKMPNPTNIRDFQVWLILLTSTPLDKMALVIAYLSLPRVHTLFMTTNTQEPFKPPGRILPENSFRIAMIKANILFYKQVEAFEGLKAVLLRKNIWYTLQVRSSYHIRRSM